MKRILAIGIILLFIGMSISSSGYNLEQQSTIEAIYDMSVANFNVDLRGDPDLIKITDINSCCDIDDCFVVYTGDEPVNKYLYIYNTKTAETDEVYMGGDISFPKISDKRVVYYDFFYNGFKMYNMTTGEKTDLIVTNWQGGGTDSFQFFGNYIAYENYDPDLYSTEIYIYNIATGENIQLTDSPGEDYPENPCIYENIVAWQLSEDNLNDIVMYNIDSKKYTRVTNTSQFESETNPSIHDNNIVYSYYYNDKTGTIIYGLKMYNILNGDETTIFEGEEPTANSPEIFGSIIVYSRSDCLYLYDLNTNYEIPIYESFWLTQPWNLNENYVLFTALGEGVYLYKYNNSPEAPIIKGPSKVKVTLKSTQGPGPYNYSFNATDPDGDNVSYFIDWGDGTSTGWIGPFESGIEIIVSHTWLKKGTYTVRAKAKDIHGAEGPWGYLNVWIPRNNLISNILIIQLMNRFPRLNQLIIRILERWSA